MEGFWHETSQLRKLLHLKWALPIIAFAFALRKFLRCPPVVPCDSVRNRKSNSHLHWSPGRIRYWGVFRVELVLFDMHVQDWYKIVHLISHLLIRLSLFHAIQAPDDKFGTLKAAFYSSLWGLLTFRGQLQSNILAYQCIAPCIYSLDS